MERHKASIFAGVAAVSIAIAIYLAKRPKDNKEPK
jgi:hypothetical protein